MSRKRDLKALEQRRLAAAKLLEKGVPQAQVARRLGVSRQSVSDWAKKFERKGKDGLKGRALGRPRQLREPFETHTGAASGCETCRCVQLKFGVPYLCLA